MASVIPVVLLKLRKLITELALFVRLLGTRLEIAKVKRHSLSRADIVQLALLIRLKMTTSHIVTYASVVFTLFCRLYAQYHFIIANKYLH